MVLSNDKGSNTKEIVFIYDDSETPLKFAKRLLKVEPLKLIILVERINEVITAHLHKFQPHSLERLQEACEKLAENIKVYLDS